MIITDPDHARQFITAGNAHFTIKSERSQTRFTYRVTRRDSIYFVSVLTGPDNSNHYTYVGIITDHFRWTRKSRIQPDAPSIVAFDWFWRHLTEKHRIPQEIELRHEGRCGRCARRLTTPESIDRGIGPDCANSISPVLLGFSKAVAIL